MMTVRYSVQDMEAADRLRFIQPFNPFEKDIEALDDREDEENVSVFMEIHSRFINTYPDNKNVFEHFDASGFIKVTESSFRLDMSDHSYLHIVFFKHEDEVGLLDMGLSLNEHSEDGTYAGGYVFLLDSDGLTRSTSLPDTDDPEAVDDETSKMHFMPSDLYALRDELILMKTSEDVEEREHAQASVLKIEQELTFDQMLIESGFDSQSPPIGELKAVKQLIMDAKPFPLHLPE